MHRLNTFHVPLVLLVLLSFLTAVTANHPQPECHNQSTISHFLSETFNANIHFIRKGVPSSVVELFYKRALSDVLPKCLCDISTLSMLCTRLVFSSHLAVKALQTLADRHPQEPPFKETNLFPQYDSRAVLLDLTTSQVQIIQSHQQAFLHYISLPHTTLFSPLDWTIRIFPTDNALYLPHGKKVTRACASYNAHVGNSKLFFSAALTTAYAISAVQVVRFANGDVPAATRILHRHVKYVYDASLCLGKSGDSLPIPASVLNKLTKRSKRLVRKSLEKLHNSPASFLQIYQYHLPAPNDMENIHLIAYLANTMYPDLVEQFSSTLSARQVQTYLDYKNYGGVSAVRRHTEELLASTNPYDFLGV